jgi:hypothetical protein
MFLYGVRECPDFLFFGSFGKSNYLSKRQILSKLKILPMFLSCGFRVLSLLSIGGNLVHVYLGGAFPFEQGAPYLPPLDIYSTIYILCLFRALAMFFCCLIGDVRF